jgi:predicted choloylglycine hydrolase
MAKIYLKIVDIDQFQDALVTDDRKGTHSVEVEDEDFTNVLDIFTKYLPKIQLHLPGLTEGLGD